MPVQCWAGVDLNQVDLQMHPNIDIALAARLVPASGLIAYFDILKEKRVFAKVCYSTY